MTRSEPAPVLTDGGPEEHAGRGADRRLPPRIADVRRRRHPARSTPHEQLGPLRGRWCYLYDRGAGNLLLRLPGGLSDPLSIDLLRALSWPPDWSSSGDGFLVPRWAVADLHRVARRFSIKLYVVRERLPELAEAG